MKMEPEGAPELTFSQRMTINRASAFITMRMERRDRVNVSKKSTKAMVKLSKMLSYQLMKGAPTIGSASEITYHGSVTLP